MYILYLDDSGSIPNPTEDYFVLGGICIPERSMNWLSSQLDDYASLESVQENIPARLIHQDNTKIESVTINFSQQ